MLRRIALVSLGYLAAIVAANLTTTHFAAQGHPEVSVYTAVALIAFDFVARDLLHDWTTGRRRLALLGALVLAGSVLSWTINRDAATIATASACAFAAAMLVDSTVYHLGRSLPWVERSNISNVFGAIVDSVVFCMIAGFPFLVGFSQATAKIAGGLAFALLLERALPVGVYRLRSPRSRLRRAIVVDEPGTLIRDAQV